MLSRALDREILPKHFSAGEDSVCFRLLREAGYRIVLKDEAPPAGVETDIGGAEPPSEGWAEGAKALKQHFGRERRPAAALVKKADFIRKHGKLFCERCRTAPVATFGSEHGEACIEVHHARAQVGNMPADHVTKLEDLQCLCANSAIASCIACFDCACLNRFDGLRHRAEPTAAAAEIT